MSTPEQSAADFLAQLKRSLKLEAYPCTVRWDLESHDNPLVPWEQQQAIEVDCVDEETVGKVFADRLNVSHRALQMGVRRINLKVQGELFLPLSPHLLTTFGKGASAMSQAANNGRLILPRQANGLRIIESKAVLDQLVAENADLKIIRFIDHIGLASGSNCLSGCGLTVEEWTGRSMDEPTPKGVSTWIPEHLKRFQTLLANHAGEDVEYEYPAYTYHGDPIYQHVRAWLGLYNGAIVRGVECLELRQGHE
jgi:hypothetical protein